MIQITQEAGKFKTHNHKGTHLIPITYSNINGIKMHFMILLFFKRSIKIN